MPDSIDAEHRSLSRSVVRLETKSWFGTGLLVSATLTGGVKIVGILTNHHVIPNKNTAMHTTATANYHQDGQKKDCVSLDPANFSTTPQGSSGDDWSFVGLNPRTINDLQKKGAVPYDLTRTATLCLRDEVLQTSVTILHHARGEPMRMATEKVIGKTSSTDFVRPGGVRKSGQNVATVSRHMMPGNVSGASGAPVFKDLKLAGMFFGTSSDDCLILKINAVVEQLRSASTASASTASASITSAIFQLDNCSRSRGSRSRSRSRSRSPTRERFCVEKHTCLQS